MKGEYYEKYKSMECKDEAGPAGTGGTGVDRRAVSARAETDVWDGTTASGFAGGTGMENDPWLIENAEQLAYLAQQVNKGKDIKGCIFGWFLTLTLAVRSGRR